MRRLVLPRRRYARLILIVEGSPFNHNSSKKEALESEITSKNDALYIHPHDNDPMVIIVRCDDWEIKTMLIDQGCFLKASPGSI